MTTTMGLYEAAQILRKAPEARQVLAANLHLTTHLDQHGVVIAARCPLCDLGIAARSEQGVRGTMSLHLEEDH